MATPAQVKSIVELLKEAKAGANIFSNLSSKKMSISVTFSLLLYAIGFFVVMPVDVWAALWFFGFGTGLVGLYVIFQAIVDVAQVGAIAKGAAIQSVEQAGKD